MGWSYGKIHCTPKEELRRLVEGPAHFAEKPSRYRLLDCAIVRFRVAYLACLDLNDGKIRALVFLVNTKEGKDGSNFGYKDMSECMGPVEADCPARILARLSPLEECYPAGSNSLKWASDWRERCRLNLERAKASKALKPGTKIKFEHPIKFTDGQTIDTFEVFNRGKAVRFKDEWGSTYRISGYKQRPFTVLA